MPKRMMTHEEIEAELGWRDEMITILLGKPEPPQIPEAVTAKRRWD
jgi:hypothetical protein